jgi:hypothetical protein
MAKKKSAKKKTSRPTATALVEQMRAIPRRCAGQFGSGWDPTETRQRINQMRVQGKRDEARALEIASRVACGRDLNDLILAHPFDGKEFSVTCPDCGTKSSHRNTPAE